MELGNLIHSSMAMVVRGNNCELCDFCREILPQLLKVSKSQILYIFLALVYYNKIPIFMKRWRDCS